jgi:thioredoxin
MIESLTGADFDATITASTLPYLVDFAAEWCPPCAALRPALEEFATEHDGTLRVGAIDIDSATAVADRFAIKSVPTLILFRDGKAVKTVFGSRNARQLRVEFAPFLT